MAADVRALALGERFGLVLAPLDLLGYALTRGDQEAVLASARRHLDPGGQLVVDVTFPSRAWFGQPDGVLVHQWTHHMAHGEIVSKWWVQEVDAAVQLQHLTAFYDVVAADGTPRRWVDALTLRYYHRYELELLLERAGFSIEGVYGNYTLDELRAESPRLLVLARPAEQP